MVGLTLDVVARCLAARWRAAVAVALAVIAGVMLYVGTLPNVYSARSVVAFTPRIGANVGAMELRAVLPAYSVYISAPSTLQRLAEVAGEDRHTLLAAIKAQVVADTSNLALKVTLPDPSQAARVANVLADEVVAYATDDALLTSRVVARAIPDGEPSGPPRGLFAGAGLVVAALLGMASAVVLERRRPRLRTYTEVASATGHQVIGRIPEARRGDPLKDPAFGAAIRSLRTRLVRRSSEEPVRALVVTSALPREGRTTVAAALAMAMVRMGTSVLLVDADVRSPGLSRRFGFRPGTEPGQRPGLLEALRGEAQLEGCLREGPLPGLSVLPTSVETDGSELLAKHFGRLLEMAQERFEMVVIDAPSMLADDYAGTLATVADGALLVVARETPEHLAAEAATTLRELEVRVLGAVANGARKSSSMTHFTMPVGAAQN